VKRTNGYAEIAGKSVGTCNRAVMAELKTNLHYWDFAEIVSFVQTSINNSPTQVDSLTPVNIVLNYPTDLFTRIQFNEY
jgi:hypothetical protein